MNRVYATTGLLAILLTASALPARAKGGGIGLSIKGGVSQVKAEGKFIRLVFKGDFQFAQFADSKKSSVEVDCQAGCSATVKQADPFFAMTTDGAGGAIQEAGGLLRILKAAEQKKRSLILEIADAKLSFSKDGRFTVLDAGIVRATDADLK